jgi:hypothetical protein
MVIGRSSVMAKPGTFFEQIAVEKVRKIAHVDLPPGGPSARCRICGNAVAIEHCKTDERGQAVHEKCYFASLERPSA